MRLQIWKCTIALMLVLSASGTVFAQTRTLGERAFSAEDMEEIRALYARYNQGSDFRDTELFLSAFAEDAVMTRGGRDIVGMDALRADRAERYQGQTGDVGRRHQNSSILIEPTPDGRAIAKAYWFLLDVTVRPAAIISSGYYVDVFVRTAAGWKIKHRTLFADAVAAQ